MCTRMVLWARQWLAALAKRWRSSSVSTRLEGEDSLRSTPSKVKKLRIFVLEDEIGHYPRNQIREVLKDFNVTYATNVIEAQLAYKGPYDLLLLDHDMEGFYEDSAH